MSIEATAELANFALARIQQAFTERKAPTVMTDSRQLLDFEYEELMSYVGLKWQDVTFNHVENNPDAVFWFSPEAFRYYLPGILAAGLAESRTDTNAYDSLIGMLDRSPEPKFWDDFFLPRWPGLSVPEIDSVAAWVRWLEAVEPGSFASNTYERVHCTLDLLRERRVGNTGPAS